MDKIWKLSPSELTFLWDECPRCFYLKVVRNFNRPWSPFPGIFNRIDKLMKDYFEGRRAVENSPELPEGKVKFGEKWVTSQPIKFPGKKSACYIKGKFDTVIAFSDGSYGVVDFKTTQPSPKHIPFYSRQLHAYAHALEDAAPGMFSLGPISKLGLLCVEPVQMDKAPDGKIAYLGEVTWLEIPRDDEWFFDFLGRVIHILDQDEPPASSENCGWCQYRQAARNTEL